MNLIIREMKNVQIKIPAKRSPKITGFTDGTHHMKKVPLKIFVQESGPPVLIPDHWHFGRSFPKDPIKKTWPPNVIVNCHFYGFSEGDLGKRKVATVVVEEKITKYGKFILLSITKAPEGSCPVFELKFPSNGKGSIPIPDTKTKIRFKRLKRE